MIEGGSAFLFFSGLLIGLFLRTIINFIEEKLPHEKIH